MATRIAGLGLAPEPLHLSPDQGAILFRRLGPEWRPATLDLLRQPDRMGAVIGPSAGSPRGAVRHPVERVRRHPPDARPPGRGGRHTLPPDAWFLFDWGETIAAALGAAGMDRRPVHGDPHASNLLFDPNGALRFVDFDMGCDADPHYQLAAFLNEACQFESDMRLGIEIAEGTCRPAVFSRCRAYGAADDLYWGLRALVMDKVSRAGAWSSANTRAGASCAAGCGSRGRISRKP